MKSKKIKLGLITTSNVLADDTRNLSADFDIDLETAFAALDDAIPFAKRMQAAGVETIMTGHGTRRRIAGHLRVPVVSFPYIAMDVITCYKRAAEIGTKVFAALQQNKIEGVEILEELLHVTIDQFSYEDIPGLKELIHLAKTKEYSVVVGGGFTIPYAKQCGLPVVEFQRSKEAITSTIEHAKAIVMANRKEREQAQRYRCIIDSVSDGIVGLDEMGRITSVNIKAEELLNIDEQNALGKSISAFLPNLPFDEIISNNRPERDRLERINNTTFLFNFHPFTVDDEIAGCVFTFKEVSNIMRSEQKIRRSFSKGHVAKYVIEDLVYACEAMHGLTAMGKQYAKTDSNLLILGETGTGKEILAQSIHNLSKRRRHPFVSINCAALPDQLLESELFGYEDGAFTGSRRGGKPGLFELAHKGTIFLDEIGETQASVQIRLLRVLQEKEIMRLGGDHLIPVDVRVIAASNKDLSKAVHRGEFREDLFFRLNVLNMSIPPLRERLEDIPVLLNKFILDFSNKYSLSPFLVPDHCVNKLMNYYWPGNIRQLQNFIERMVLLSDSSFSQKVFDKLYGELKEYQFNNNMVSSTMNNNTLKDEMNDLKKQAELDIIERALEKTQYSKTRAASLLGISRTTLWKKMKEAGY